MRTIERTSRFKRDYTSGSPRVPTGAGTPEFRAETIEAMREARRGNLPQFASVEELLDDLHADD